MNAKQVEWRTIPGYENYEVSNLGQVRNKKTGHVLATNDKNHYGYHRIGLYRNGKQKTVSIHSLVMLGFVGPRPEGLDVCHYNGIRNDNRLENLGYVTPKENARHRILHGNQATKEGHGSAKLTEEDVEYIRNNLRKWDKDLGVVGMARKFGVHPTTLNSMLKGETWRDDSLIAYKEGK